MLGAVFQIMWLRLWRDKGALVLAFILPGFIFAIFAAIFSNASGGNLDLRIAMAVTSDAPASRAFADNLTQKAEFSVTTSPKWTIDDVRKRVRLGQDDVGVVISGDIANPAIPGMTIVTDPGRQVATTILKGQIRQSIADQAGLDAPELFMETSALSEPSSRGPKDPSVTYYIGATAILFLLFSAMQGAAITLYERNSGISDRLLIGPRGALSMLSGKFLFLALIGTLQAAIIVIVANLFFDVPIAGKLPALMLACLGAAAISASLALLLASLCSSAAQMNSVSTFIVLLFSAAGGSMVPRFMMPESLQSIGTFTPNHWAIEAFYGTLAREQSIMDLTGTWGVLFGGALIYLLLAAIISHRFMRT